MCKMISICPAELISFSPVERFGADPYNGGEELCKQHECKIRVGFINVALVMHV